MEQNILLIGDIHGDFDWINKVARKRKNNLIIQLGDYGLFDNKRDRKRNIPSNIKFIRGNHDCPEVCALKENYLGDFGIYNNIFFISGARSVDKDERVAGVTWWENEQLSYEQLNRMIDLYKEVKPKIVISHEGPSSIISQIISNRYPNGYPYEPYLTSLALNKLLEFHRPEKWFFGHHHCSFVRLSQGTLFRCVDINEIIQLTE